MAIQGAEGVCEAEPWFGHSENEGHQRCSYAGRQGVKHVSGHHAVFAEVSGGEP